MNTIKAIPLKPWGWKTLSARTATKSTNCARITKTATRGGNTSGWTVTATTPVLHPDTDPIIQKWILRFPLRLHGRNHRRPRHYRQYRPRRLCVFLRFLCEPCNRAPALQEAGKDSAHICALLYKQPHSPSAVDCACNKKVTYWPP